MVFGPCDWIEFSIVLADWDGVKMTAPAGAVGFRSAPTFALAPIVEKMTPRGGKEQTTVKRFEARPTYAMAARARCFFRACK